jgi:hypothetical protein
MKGPGGFGLRSFRRRCVTQAGRQGQQA